MVFDSPVFRHMKKVKSHYCFGEGSHPDGCDCACDTCNTKREELRREAANARLSQRIQEVFHDSEFRSYLVKELEKK